jgi:[CysO sulfur-carrier protein]-S-L-cysteine hydrolase
VSIPFRLVLPTQLRDEMFAQAQAELPNECCGQLAGSVDADGLARVVKRYPLLNTAASPIKYLADGPDLFTAARDMRERGIDLLAIYHSHPTSNPVPSKTDMEQSFYGCQVVNLIISLQSGKPVMRGWWLTETGHTEAEWDIV